MKYQLIVPDSLKTLVWKGYHERAGHMGIEKTSGLLWNWFYWVQMAVDIESWCAACLRKDPPRRTKVPFSDSIQTTAPLELLAMDFLKLDCSSGGYQYVLVLTDHFTKFAWAIPTHDQLTVTTAKVLWQNIIQPFGGPQ